ncbi:MAG: DUF4012 domain-containing protein [Minisyncoccia bacterium]|jgi:hypothetical protein
MPGTVPPPRKDEEIRSSDLVKVIKQEPKDEALEKKRLLPRGPRLPKGIVWGIAGLVVLFVGGSIVSFYLVRAKVASSFSMSLGTLRLGVEDLQNFDPQSAKQKFSSLQGLSSGDLGAAVKAFGSLLGGGGGAVTSLVNLSNQLTLFAQEASDVASSSYGFFTTGRGGPFIADLGRMRDTLGTIDAASDQLTGAASFLGGLSSFGGNDFYLSLKTQIKSTENALTVLLPWLSDPRPHHFLVLLENPSEMRPAGGFLGSYADVTIASGTITDIAIHDVADVDATFNRNIIPPKPLQLEVKGWRPADANWFFDFPTSASKTIAFFEESALYANASTTFDGAVAVSPKVIGDLLAITGPIVTGKPTTTFTADNFLIQIQKIVQSGQSSSATYPKKVIGDLSKAIFAALASSTADGHDALFAAALDWITKKDVMVYFKDPAAEAIADANGASGAVYALPQQFNGDYLAVVDANVNGGKSDLYVSSTIAYTAQINPDGTMTGHLVVTRKHNGVKSPYWWYQTTNQDYAQIFVPEGATLANVSGTVLKKITPPINYAKKGYETDPTVSAIESTEQTLFAYPGVAWHEESGKEVFTTWSVVKAGASTQFSLDYTYPASLPPADGVAYQFVFEKQAGTHRSYEYDIDAPLGYVFVENGGLATYSYQSDDPPGRLIFNLTLQKL